MIEQEFLDSLPDEPLKIIQAISNLVIDRYNLTPSNVADLEKDYEFYIDAFGLFQAFATAHNFKFTYPILKLKKIDNINALVGFFNDKNLEAEKTIGDLLLENAKERYTVVFKKAFYYEFTDGDLKRIQELLNEIRDITNETEEFEDEHRERILKRIEKLQQELHKKMSNLDKFWSLIGDAGVALGKLGNDAKPFVDRISEIVNIVWRVQSIAEELPSGSLQPLLKEHIDFKNNKKT